MTELEQLIADQARDARLGDRVHSLSIDAWPSGLDALLAPRRLVAAPRYPHGTMSSYTHGRCRCRVCRDASAAYARERRLRKAGLA